tara:strand:+ start:10736 stop:13219 length:2484 start_codon:yes stop_codon:yes gene_type:complete
MMFWQGTNFMANDSDSTPPNDASSAPDVEGGRSPVRIIDKLKPVPVELPESPKLPGKPTMEIRKSKPPEESPPDKPTPQPTYQEPELARTKPETEETSSPKPERPPSAAVPSKPQEPPAKPNTPRLGPEPKARRPRKQQPEPERPDAPALEIDWAGDDTDTGRVSAKKPRALIDVDLGKKRRDDDRNQGERRPTKGTARFLVEPKTKPRKEPTSKQKTKPKAAPKPQEVEEEFHLQPKLGLIARLGLGIRDLIFLFFASVPILAAAWLVDWKAVNVPFEAEWGRVDVLAKVLQDQLTVSEFLAPENGQRQPVVRAAYIFLSTLTDHDIKMEVWVSFAALAATAAGIFFLLGRTVGSGMKLGITFLLANLLLFSPAHAQAMLSASTLGIHLANACLIWGIFFATRSLPWWLRLGFCLFFGVVGSYSAIHALAIWPAVLILQLLSGNAGRIWHRFLFVVVWLAVGSFVFIDYFSTANPDGSRSFTAAEQVQNIDVETEITEWFSLSGDLILRGWQPPEQREFFVIPGLIVVSLFLLCAIGWLMSSLGRSRTLLWNRCLPWVGIGASCLLGAMLISVLIDSSQASNTGLDFSLVLMPTLISIVALFTILTTDKVQRSPQSSISDHLPIWWATAVCGVLLHQGGAWYQGYWMINDVQADRLKTRSQLVFLDVHPPQELFGFGTKDLSVATKRAHFLDQNKYLKPALFPNLRMEPFSLETEPLSSEQAELYVPEIEGNTLHFRGIAEIPGFQSRPADLVAMVRQLPQDGVREILKLAKASELGPRAWELSISNSLNDTLEFWVLDMATMKAFPIGKQYSKRDGIPVLESFAF